MDSLFFDIEREQRLKILSFKVVRFAMDKIRANTVLSLQENFASKGTNCNCWDKVNYMLPCPCVIHGHPGILLLNTVHPRWRFEFDDGKSLISCMKMYLILDPF